ncbi:hypothetical protein AMJ44_02915 [candidate division WOR-1 bacterium DG_54_3]|uniref:Uncharacterized protein n=1 Tax=candidate division WOR-1 bacterium DG_54_3 TaxID=1703775 RepID=A0A0S7Y4Z9_UNCSA|nr:MAG: hypothetical protein AMJ44_02915 [candidate division WOR-1 bacterium DG_54_3]
MPFELPQLFKFYLPDRAIQKKVVYRSIVLVDTETVRLITHGSIHMAIIIMGVYLSPTEGLLSTSNLEMRYMICCFDIGDFSRLLYIYQP